MAQYINKDALVAWLKERIRDYWCDSYALEEVIKYVDTLEGKDVDLEKEVDKWYNNKAPKEFENILYRDIEKFAKHFFELGLSVSNKAEKKELEEEPYIMGETGKFTTTTKAQKGK